MSYLISQLWGWLLIALILGAAVGWLTCAGRRADWLSGWVPWGLAAFVVGLILALLAWFPGRYGLLLESGLLLFTAYIVGCCLGCWLKQMLAPAAPVAAFVAAAKPVARPAAVAAPAPAPAPVAKPVPAPAPAATVPPEPAAAAKIADEDKHEGRRPPGYVSPRGGKADDLKRIRGIGPQNEGRLHALGVWHFDQIAAWTHDNVLWVGSYLAFPGRIDRETWIDQAKILAKGLETDFSKRVDKGEVATSKDSGDKGAHNIARLDPKK